ncbi:holin [Staphylococcus phage vB-SscS-F1]|nr:holin [Arcanobacterium phage vB-ApyS-JF1]
MEKGNFLGINWKVRANNPQFWFQIFLAIAVPIGTYFGVTGKDVTSWKVLIDLIGQAVSNPYVIAMVAVSVYNAVNDPSTKGVKDGENALEYVKPSQKKYYGDGSIPEIAETEIADESEILDDNVEEPKEEVFIEPEDDKKDKNI